MDRLDVMRLFVRIVDRASFSDAAKDMHVPRASVTRAIQQLEAQLGVRLLERSTRAVRATDDGRLYYARCVDLLARLDEAEGMFESSEPTGSVCADVQGTLARFFVVPALSGFIARHPRITLHLTEGDRMVDLVAEGLDCVLRAGALPDSTLVGRQVAVAEQLTLASPAYLQMFGVPRTLAHLADHRMVAYVASSSGQPYGLDFMDGGKEREVTLPYDITVRGAEIYTASAVGGLGLIQVPRYRVQQQLDSGELVIVLPDHPPPPMPVSVLHPSSRHLSPRVRVFIDWLAELFQSAQREGRI